MLCDDDGEEEQEANSFSRPECTHVMHHLLFAFSSTDRHHRHRLILLPSGATFLPLSARHALQKLHAMQASLHWRSFFLEGGDVLNKYTIRTCATASLSCSTTRKTLHNITVSPFPLISFFFFARRLFNSFVQFPLFFCNLMKAEFFFLVCIS